MNRSPTCETCGTRLVSADSPCAFGHRRQRPVATPPPGTWAVVDPNGPAPAAWGTTGPSQPPPGAWGGYGPSQPPPGGWAPTDPSQPASGAYAPPGSIQPAPGGWGVTDPGRPQPAWDLPGPGEPQPGVYAAPGLSQAGGWRPTAPIRSHGARAVASGPNQSQPAVYAPTGPNQPAPVWGAPGAWGPPAGPFPAGWGPYPAPGRARRSRLLPVAMVATLGLVGMTLALYPRGTDGPPHPETWDPQVAAIAAFVEAERELSFEQPVYVDFLTPDEYRQAATADEPTATEGDDALADEADDQYVGSLRALGLLQGEPDMDQASDDLSDGGTLAFYDPETERITVRGTEMTPGLRVTLAHELTHALQDQNFDLERMYEMRSVQAEDFRAVIEGDAQRVEAVYVEDGLDDDEQSAYEAESQEASDEGEAATAESVPDIVLTSFASPYILGGAFIELLFQLEGNAGVDRALETPPATDAQLFDPFRFLTPTDALEVDAPDPVGGGEVLDEGEFGTTNLYLLLASRIDAGEALAAVDGWGGDAMVLSESDGEVCMQVAVQGTTAETTLALGAALTRWSESMPGDGDRVEVGDGAAPVELTACDPGVDAALAVAPDMTRALNLPSFRTYMAAQTIEYRGFREAEADCAGDDLASKVDLDQLDDWDALFEDPVFVEQLEQVLVACEI